MAMEYGTPSHWATFTCNETGWSDLVAACDGEHHSERPVEATRQYNRRWDAFLRKYLHGDTPIGTIERVWWRHEDQARGSLHIHICIWVKPDTIRDEGIVATAPRGVQTRAEREWRQFVRRVQRHDCRPKCHRTTAEGGECSTDCKYGYPRRVWARDELQPGADGELVYAKIDKQTDRYQYRTELPEDERLSPYVPEWLLAWGASINVQRCTGSVFMHYVAKCARSCHTPTIHTTLHPQPPTLP
jgi:hypothetical protein